MDILNTKKMKHHLLYILIIFSAINIIIISIPILSFLYLMLNPDDAGICLWNEGGICPIHGW